MGLLRFSGVHSLNWKYSSLTYHMSLTFWFSAASSTWCSFLIYLGFRDPSVTHCHRLNHFSEDLYFTGTIPHIRLFGRDFCWVTVGVACQTKASHKLWTKSLNQKNEKKRKQRERQSFSERWVNYTANNASVSRVLQCKEEKRNLNGDYFSVQRGMCQIMQKVVFFVQLYENESFTKQTEGI